MSTPGAEYTDHRDRHGDHIAVLTITGPNGAPHRFAFAGQWGTCGAFVGDGRDLAGTWRGRAISRKLRTQTRAQA